MGKIIRYVHHKATVAVDEDLLGRHREHCLCWQGCQNFHPGSTENCPIATKLFDLDVKYNLVTPVWECPVYLPQKEKK